MTKQKKSFFEKLTGIQRVDDESEIEITNSSKEEEVKEMDDPYEFPTTKEKDSEEDLFEEEEKQESDEIIEESGEDLITPAAPPKSKKLEVEEDKKEAVEENESEEIGTDAEGQLTIDVYQTPKDIVIKSTIAGVKPEDLDVDINSEMVTIKGKRSQEEEVDAEDYYYQECYWGPFSRSIILPVEIVTEKAEATMKNGILTIRLPKMEVAKSRKLQVRGF